MTNEDKKNYILNFLFLICILATIAVVLYSMTVITPFIIGFGIAFVLKPVAVLITKWTGFRRKGSAIFVTSLFYVAVFALIWLLGVIIATQLSHLFSGLPTLYAEKIEPELYGIADYFSSIISQLSPQISETLYDIFKNITSSITNVLSTLSTSLIGGITGIAKNVPLYLLTLIFSIVSSVLISVDYHKVTTFFMRQFSAKGQKILLESKIFLVNTVFKMAKAYIIILFITFVELSAGLLLLGTEYAFPIAAITALMDILPFLGTGAVMIPWGIYSIVVTKDLTFGVGLLILYAIITVVRNIIEPRIVGKSIGLHPLVTITAMFAGLKLFGFLGLFLAPIIVLLLKHLNEKELVHIYKI